MAALFKRKQKASLTFVDPTTLAPEAGQAAQGVFAMSGDPGGGTSYSAFPVPDGPSYGGFPGGPIEGGTPPIGGAMPPGTSYSAFPDPGGPSYGGFPGGPVEGGTPPIGGVTPPGTTYSAFPTPGGDPSYVGFPTGGTTAPMPAGSPGDANPSELTPIEGHPGQFTDGRGKGGGDDINGSMQYGVYDQSGKFLGWNETVHINGETTNYGYSYGSAIPDHIDIPTGGLNGGVGTPGSTALSPEIAPATSASAPPSNANTPNPEPDAVDRWMAAHPSNIHQGGGFMDPGAPAGSTGQLGGTGHTVMPPAASANTPNELPSPVVTSASPTPEPSDAVDRWMANHPAPGAPTTKKIEVTVDDGSGGFSSPQPAAPASIVPTNVPTLPPTDETTSPPTGVGAIDPSSVASNVHHGGRFMME